jgi:rhodanese-related sulfurtransferase
MSRKHSQSKHTTSRPASHRRHKIHKRNFAWLWVGLGVLLVSVVGILLLNSKNTPSVEISPSQAYAKYQQGIFFLDVRSQEEWDQYHIAGSTLIPLDDLQNRLGELPIDQEIVVVCRSGHRSQSGVTILREAGFTRVSCLSGGLLAWTAAGYPVEGDSP